MLYNNNNTWAAAQRKDLGYYYVERHFHNIRSLDELLSDCAPSLKPIGPTMLVEWNEE